MKGPRLPTSLAGRSVIALVLFIGYYLLSVVVAAVLVVAGLAGLKYGASNFWLVFFYFLCFAAAAMILWAIVPRLERFQEPGPRLTRESDPRLFDEITRVARKMGQKAPAEMYLVPGVTAWVSERGGFMGLGSRRIAGVGLMLLQGLAVGEFRAVLAHEFGHFSRGDTRLGPWIYRTRATIGRTLQKLPTLSLFGKHAAALGSLIQQPFILYGNWFLRITQAISRRQEYLADELAASTAGKDTAISALRRIFIAELASQMYWTGELERVLNAGFRPPFAAGFGLYLEAEPTVEEVTKALAWHLENVRSEPHDSHPSLGERIKALEALPAGGGPKAGPPAASLLEAVPEREKELFAFMNPEAGPRLKPIDWGDVTAVVHVPFWTALAKLHRADLAGVTPKDIPGKLPGLAEWGRQMAATSRQVLIDDQAKAYAAYVITVAIASKLVERGWQASCPLGRQAVLRHGEKSWEPFKTVYSFVDGETTSEVWLRLCEEMGFGDLDLGPTEPDPDADSFPEQSVLPAEPAAEKTMPAGRRTLPFNPAYLLGIMAALMLGLVGLFRNHDSVFEGPGLSAYRRPGLPPSQSDGRAGNVTGRPSAGTGLPFSLSVREPDLVAGVTKWSSGLRSYGATVEVRNRSAKTYHFIMVRVDFCDGTGRIVGTLMTEARRDDYILPGGMKSFTVTRNGRLVFATARASVVYSVEVK